MDTAPCDDQYFSAFTHFKSVIDEIVQSAFRNNHRDMYRLINHSRADSDVNPGFVAFRDDLDSRCGFPGDGGSVFPDIISPAGYCMKISNFGQ